MIKNNILNLKQTSHWNDKFFLILILSLFYLLSSALRPLNLPDEGRYPSVALGMLHKNDYINTFLNGVPFMDKPVLFYWLDAFCIKIFGLNEWSVRLPCALSGIWGAVLTQHATYRLFDRKTGLIAGIVLGTSFLYYACAGYADVDILVAVLVSSALFFALLGLIENNKKKHARYFYLAWIFAALAFLTKGLIGIVFPIMVLGAFSIITRDWGLIKRIHLLKGSIIFFAICFPWFYLMQKSNPTFLDYFFINQQFTRFVSTGFNNEQSSFFYVLVVFVGILPWSLFLPSVLKNSSWLQLKSKPMIYFIIWFVLVFIFFSIPNSKLISYILPVFPPLAIFIAVYLNRWLQLKNFPVLCCLSAFLYGVLGVFLILLGYEKILIPDFIAKESLRYFIPLGFFISAISFMIIARCIKNKRSNIFILICLNCAVLWPSINSLSKDYNNLSTKELSSLIKDKIKPDTQIINYQHYYYDVPIYLNYKKKHVCCR